jgi:hypothetical protein
MLRIDDLTQVVRDISLVGNGLFLEVFLVFAYSTHRFVCAVWKVASAEGKYIRTQKRDGRKRPEQSRSAEEPLASRTCSCYHWKENCAVWM